MNADAADRTRFLIGHDYEGMVASGTDRPMGRGGNGSWYIDPVIIAKNTYLRALAADHSDLDEDSQARIAYRRATENKDAAMRQFRAELARQSCGPDYDTLMNDIAIKIGAVATEEVAHAVGEYEHPIELSFTHPEQSVRSRAEQVLSDSFSSYRRENPENDARRLRFGIDEEDLAAAVETLETVVAEYDKPGELDVLGDYRFDGEDAFFEELVRG